MSTRLRILVTLALVATGLTVGAAVDAEDAAGQTGVCAERVTPQFQPWRPQAWAVEHVGQDRSSAPTAADVDGDGVDDVVWGDERGMIHAHRADGRSLAGFPAPATLEGSTAPSAVGSSPLVADLDGDGDAEIVVGVGTLVVQDQPGGVVALDHRGRRIWSHRTSDVYDMWDGGGPDGLGEGVWSTPAAGDVDGDGHTDVVVGSFDHRVHALDRHGRPVAGFPYRHDDTIWSSPALFDVDGDGRDEVFVGVDSFRDTGGRVLSLEWEAGAVRVRWSQVVGDIVQSSPAIADVDGDGRAEVVVGTGSFFGGTGRRNVWAWHADDGSPQPGWPATLAGTVSGSPALGDVDGDGRLDVVIADRERTVYALRHDGSRIWATNPARGISVDPGTGFWSSPMVADLDGDGGQDVAITGGYGTYVLRGRDGARLDAGPFLVNHGQAWLGGGSPLVADFGAAGWHLVVAGFDTGRDCTRVAAYRLAAPGAPAAWPMWRGGPDHRASKHPTVLAPLPEACRPPSNPPAAPAASAARGYWVLDGGGAVRAFGVPHHGDVAGALPAGRRAVALTATASGAGYWILDSGGGVHAFGDAVDHGSVSDVLPPGRALAGPIISMAALPTGNGYWLLGEDGGVFSFGAARFQGSVPGVLPPGRTLDGPIISMVPTLTGRGYWLIADDGGMFSFGDADFHGSVPGVLGPGRSLAAPIISAAVHPRGVGYWMLGADGGVFSFDVPYRGSVPGMGLCRAPATVEMRPTATGSGYYVLLATGRVLTFGDAVHRGHGPVVNPVDLAVRW